MNAVGQAPGGAHQAGGARVLADAHEHPFPRGPRSLDGPRLHFGEQLLVHPLGGAPQRELAQRDQIGRREEMHQRAFGLQRNVDFAFFETLDQIVGREVDQLHRVGAIEYRVRYRLAHANMRDLRDDVVQAFDVLNIDGRIDVDAMLQYLFDVEIALGMPAAFCIGMGKLVDQCDLRPARDDRVNIHFRQRSALVFDLTARNKFEALHQRLGFLAAVGLDDADDDIIAVFFAGAGGLQHRVGLADARRGADENPQLANTAFLAPSGLQQGFRRRPLIGIAPLLCHP